MRSIPQCVRGVLENSGKNHSVLPLAPVCEPEGGAELNGPRTPPVPGQSLHKNMRKGHALAPSVSPAPSPSPNSVLRLLFFIHGRAALHKGDLRQGKAGRVSTVVAGGGVGGAGTESFIRAMETIQCLSPGDAGAGEGEPRWAQAEGKQAQG